MPRFAILEHTGAPDDPAGRHFDLLLETGDACLTWRLVSLPSAGGTAVTAVSLPRHRLAWLEHESGPVSGGRGFARRIDSGSFTIVSGCAEEPVGQAAIEIDMTGERLAGRLRLEGCGRCQLT